MGWSDSEVGFDEEAGKKTDKAEGKTFLKIRILMRYRNFLNLAGRLAGHHT